MGCDYCKTGRYNLCPDMTFAATPPVDGNLRQYYCHPADFCFKIPDSMTMEEAALMEPTAVAVHSCRRAGVELGKTVLICGAGPIGLVNVVTSLAMGATEVVVTDIDEGRLKVAKSLGATGTYLVKRGRLLKNVLKKLPIFSPDILSLILQSNAAGHNQVYVLVSTQLGQEVLWYALVLEQSI